MKRSLCSLCRQYVCWFMLFFLSCDLYVFCYNMNGIWIHFQLSYVFSENCRQCRNSSAVETVVHRLGEPVLLGERVASHKQAPVIMHWTYFYISKTCFRLHHLINSSLTLSYGGL